MRVNKCGEQMLKMKPQHRKQGKQGTCTITPKVFLRVQEAFTVRFLMCI